MGGDKEQVEYFYLFYVMPCCVCVHECVCVVVVVVAYIA